MSLEELQDDVDREYDDIGSNLSVSLDRETRNELALLACALGPEETDELVRRAVHNLFESLVERGTLDFHLRTGYDCTYDEYLSGMSFDQMTEQAPPQQEDDRRYQF